MRLIELEALRSILHGVGAPNWMRSVLATSLGTKIVNRQQGPEPCIQLYVREKLAESRLDSQERIPKKFGGIETDIIRMSGEVNLDGLATRQVLPNPENAQARTASGAAVATISSKSRTATLTCAARSTRGPVVLTAAHAVYKLEQVQFETGSRPQIGTCVARWETVEASLLYDDPRAPSLPTVLDLAVIELDNGVQVAGGLTDSDAFVVASSSVDLAVSLLRSPTTVFSWSPRLGKWRYGSVTGLFPRVHGGAVQGFAAIQHSPRSVDGDSGSLWCAETSNGYVAVGAHWGLPTEWSNGHAFVTDTTAGLRLLNAHAAARPASRVGR